MSQLPLDTSTFRVDRRGVSSTVGYVLIVGVVITAALGVVSTGLVTVDNSRQLAETGTAITAMSQFSSSADHVSSAGGQQSIALAADSSQQIVISDESRIKIEIRNSTADDAGQNTSLVLLNETLPALTYRTEQALIAYQGGGVWRIDPDDTQGNTALEVSPPQFTRQSGITIPIITPTAAPEFISDDGQMTISDPETQRIYPASGGGHESNTIADTKEMAITITSPYYRAWGRTLETQLERPVTLDHQNDSVSVTISGDTKQATQTRITGINAGSYVQANGERGTVSIDGYDSRLDTYETTSSMNTTLTSNRGVDLSNGVTVDGNVKTKGDTVLIGDVDVNGDVATSGSVVTQGTQTDISGPISQATTLSDPRTIDDLIQTVSAEFRSNNTNADSTRVSNGQITTQRVLKTSNDPTVTAGQYYLTNLTVDDADELTFDVSGGNIQIVVDNGVNMNGGTVNVTGTTGNSNRVQIFTRGGSVSVVDSTISSPGDDSTRLWLYGGKGTHVDMVSSSVTAAVYTPGTPDSPSQLTVKNGTTLYGGVVTSEAKLSAGASVHHDRALRGSDVFRAGTQIPLPAQQKTPIRISRTRVTVTDS